MPNPILMGQAQRIPDPRAGDICRLRDVEGLWMPYEGVGGRSDGDVVKFYKWRFARYPKLDAVRTFELSSVEEVVHPCHSEESRAFWTLVTKQEPS